MPFSAKLERNPLTNVLPGLQSLWEKSLGDPRVTIAILDGPVDQSHPCFNGAKLTPLPTLVAGEATPGLATQHGTHVASVIWGQLDSEVRGLAPACRGLIVPVFTAGSVDKLAPCSQIDLARAITQAVEAGAKVINISGGQLTASGESDRLFSRSHAPAWECRGRARGAEKGRWRVHTGFPRGRVGTRKVQNWLGEISDELANGSRTLSATMATD
jgi:subtilisin family serine protease